VLQATMVLKKPVVPDHVLLYIERELRAA
jgi:hypothetical protein